MEKSRMVLIAERWIDVLAMGFIANCIAIPLSRILPEWLWVFLFLIFSLSAYENRGRIMAWLGIRHFFTCAPGWAGGVVMYPVVNNLLGWLIK